MTSSYPLPSIAGLDTGGTWPTASEYFKYVSIDATTTRASTVIRSIPTSETRTQASITIPLSRTRSSTSIRLVPPGALSTGIERLLHLRGSAATSFQYRSAAAVQRGELPFERAHLFPQLVVLGR